MTFNWIFVADFLGNVFRRREAHCRLVISTAAGVGLGLRAANEMLTEED